MRKNFFCIYIIFLFTILFSNPLTADNFPALKQSSFNLEADYYGLPINVKAGYLYRYNDLSIFPYVGIEFNNKDYLYLESFTGISFCFKNFSWDNKFSYELMPSLINKDFDIFYGQTRPGIAFNYAKFSIPVSVGFHKYGTTDGKTLKSKFISLGLESSFFIFDKGWTKAQINTGQSFTALLYNNYEFIDLSLDTPVTFFTNYTDIAFTYSFKYLKEINRIEENVSYCSSVVSDRPDIRVPYSKISGRIFFTGENEKKYNHIHSLELETRWYFLRYINSFSSIFLSFFGNIGTGIDCDRSWNFLYEYGIGFGYNLVDSVPFTIQAGFNQDNKFVLYTGVVSHITHRP